MNSKLKYIGIAVIVATLIVVIKFDLETLKTTASQGFDYLQALLINALQWIDGLGPLAAIIFIGIYIVATVFFIPPSVLTLGAGVIFGVFEGSLYVFIGATIGASLAFFVGRYIARGWVEKQIQGNPRFKAIDQAVAEEGIKIVLLTRLSPIFPFSLLNYAYGLAKVTYKDYVLGTLGILPGTIMFVYVGSLAQNLAAIGAGAEGVDKPSEIELIFQIIGLLATIAVTIYIGKIAKKALSQRVETEPDT